MSADMFWARWQYTKRHRDQVEGLTIEARSTEAGLSGLPVGKEGRCLETEASAWSQEYFKDLHLCKSAVEDANIITRIVKGKGGDCWF